MKDTGLVMSEHSHLPDELNRSEDADNDSINILRGLVEKLSTSEGKTISWKTLSKLVEMHNPASLIDPMEDYLSDGCRIIRELPARSMQKAESNESTTFKFQLPYSMRCSIESTPSFAQDKKKSAESYSLDVASTQRALELKTQKMLSNNKKRKSVRAQTYLKREAEATMDDMSRADEVHDADYGSDESRFRDLSGEEEKDGSDIDDDVEVPRRFWYRRKEDRLPFSHEEKARRLRAVKARCRIRRMVKARESKDIKDGEAGSIEDSNNKLNEVEKSSSSIVKKPSRVERRAAALRRENGGVKARPTLAELRARIGKVTLKEDVAAAASRLPIDANGAMEGLKVQSPPSKASSLSLSTPPSSSSFSSSSSHKTLTSKKVIQPPTCLFTFTSKSIAANRLVSMRAELDTLHKNLQEARRDFEDLRRLEKESLSTTTASRVLGGTASDVSKSSSMAAASIAHDSHDKMLQSVKALTASCKAITNVAVATQKELKVHDAGQTKVSTKTTTAGANTSLSSGAISSDIAVDKTALAASLKSSSIIANPTLSPPPPPPPPSLTSAVPITSPQQKTPPPLSRRRKANMSNIHHISNHRPSRQVTSEGVRSVSNSSHQPLAAQEMTVPGLDHPTTTTSLFANEWMCVFCEYRLLYGEYPRMMGAVKSRKKLVAKKKDAQERAHRATTVGAPASTKTKLQCTCGRAHAKAMKVAAKFDDDYDDDDTYDDPHHHHETHHHNDEHDHHHHHHDNSDRQQSHLQDHHNEQGDEQRASTRPQPLKQQINKI